MRKPFAIFLNFLFIFNFSTSGYVFCALGNGECGESKSDGLSAVKSVDESELLGKISCQFGIGKAIPKLRGRICGPKTTEKPILAEVPLGVSVPEKCERTRKSDITPLKISTGPDVFSKIANDKAALVFNVTYDPMFGQILVDTSDEKLKEAGFEYGDSVDIYFSNGKYLLGVPYLSGYSTRTGEPLLVCYHGNSYLAVCRNNWDSLWKEAKLKDGDSVAIKINEKGKFLTAEEALSLIYSNKRSDYASDKVFANYRECVGGNMRKGVIYRSASPFDDKYNRVECTNNCMKNGGIVFVINLSDKEETVKSITESTRGKNYAGSIYEDGRCICLGMACNYQSRVYAQKLVEGLNSYIGYCEKHNNGEPVKLLIHCLEGKDRTGFVCALLLMLCDASYEEILVDYMETYENYYGVTRQSDLEKYESIRDFKFNDFFDYLMNNHIRSNDVDTGCSCYAEAAVNYLKYGGMSDEQIKVLRKLISKSN